MKSCLEAYHFYDTSENLLGKKKKLFSYIHFISSYYIQPYFPHSCVLTEKESRNPSLIPNSDLESVTVLMMQRS